MFQLLIQQSTRPGAVRTSWTVSMLPILFLLEPLHLQDVFRMIWVVEGAREEMAPLAVMKAH